MNRTASSPTGGVLPEAQRAAAMASLTFAIVFVTVRLLLDRTIDPLALLLGGIGGSMVGSIAHRRDRPVALAAAVVALAAVAVAVIAG